MTNEESKAILGAIDFDREPPDSPELRQAVEQLAASPELQEWFAAERAFDDKVHAELADCEIPLPEYLHAGLEASASNMEDGGEKRRFIPRRRFLIAALLTGGVSFGAYRFQFPHIPYRGAQTPLSAASPASMDDFFDFVTTFVANGFSLDYYTDSPVEGQNWIENQRGPISSIGNTLLAMDAMGCKIIPWRDHEVSFLCLQDADGHYVHLFRIAETFCERSDATAGNPESQYHFEAKRTCRIWHESPCACILVPHKRGQELPTSLA